VDDTAAEAAVLGGDRAGRDFRFLNGILDEEVQGLAAQVLVHDDTVDEVLALEGEPTGHHDVAARTVARYPGSQEHGVIQRATDREPLERLFLEVARNRGGRNDLGRLPDD